MAAHMVRRLFCRRAQLMSQHMKQPTHRVLIIDYKNTLQWTVGYSSRRQNSIQNTQVQIPLERLTVSYSRSSGPGGQHVNKVSTKAEVRFNVHTADWIPEDVRQKIIEKNKNRINKAGELLVTSELSRSQQRNLSDCIQRISAIIAEASEKPHEPTAEDIALRATRTPCPSKLRTEEALWREGETFSRKPFSPVDTERSTLDNHDLDELEKRKKERLNQKRMNSVIKKSRQVDFD